MKFYTVMVLSPAGELYRDTLKFKSIGEAIVTAMKSLNYLGLDEKLLFVVAYEQPQPQR